MGDVGVWLVDHLGFLDVSKLERSESYEAILERSERGSGGIEWDASGVE